MFVFKFEKIINLKDNLIKKCMLEIANIEATIKKLNDTKKELSKENKKRKEKLNDILSKDKPDKNMLLFLSENIAKTENSIITITNNISELEKEKRKKIKEAEILNMEKKKLEKLKEKEYENYVKEEKKAETRFLDEIANIKSANNIING